LRIRARFAPAEVTRIGQIRDHWEGKTRFRELRPGDIIHPGDVLGIFYSVDVGNKKNDLYEAILQLKLDEEILEGAESARGSVPHIYLLNAKKAVLADRSAITRAENTLRAWNIAQEDIDSVKHEAEKADLDTLKLARSKKTKKQRDRAAELAKREQLDRWARVELKVPLSSGPEEADGRKGPTWALLERNVALREIVVDGTTNLFVLARVDQIAVIANAPEDDLPALQKLSDEQRRWTIRTVGTPDDKPLEGPISDIGYLIDPNQHTALIKGYINNPGKRLRGGQFVTVTIDMPVPPDVVEVPMSAIVDDGKQCVVFVQPDPSKPHYTMRRVLLTHRFDNVAWVRSKLTKKQQELKPEEKEQGLLVPQPLLPDRAVNGKKLPGDRVILSGVLELKKEVEDRMGSPRLDRTPLAEKAETKTADDA
jgi:cobalt-zinc-cadmium efflux system membrane fusion protein